MKFCPCCGAGKPIEDFGKRGPEGRWTKSYCRVCSRSGTRRYRELHPSARLLSSCKTRAKRLGVPFDLALSDLTIPPLCPILGIPLHPDYRRRTDNTPSVDRLIPSLGYVPGNVRVISWRANRLKSDATPAEVCRIAAYVLSASA